jgi:hypothetical protein
MNPTARSCDPADDQFASSIGEVCDLPRESGIEALVGVAERHSF